MLPLNTMHKSFPSTRVYIPIRYKFYLCQLVSLIWTGISIWLSIPWVRELGMFVTIPGALSAIIGLAYIPGYLNAFQVTSLLIDRQPQLKFNEPTNAVTILIAAWNEERGIESSLSQIVKQDYTGRIKVLIIDNNSTDDTVHVARKYATEHRLDLECLFEPKPGKSHALNYGLTQVETELVITLDADTLLHVSAVRYLVSRFLSSPSDVCAVAGAILVRNSRENVLTKMQEWDYFLGIASTKRLQGMYQSTLVAQGAFSLYKTEAIRGVGGWADAIGEDIVLTWRFFRKGWMVYFEPLAVGFTDTPERFRHFVKQRSRWARGMIEGIKEVKPWEHPILFTKFLTGIDLVIPYLDLSYTFLWLPGLILAFFGSFYIVGPMTLLVLPLTLMSNLILYLYQRRVFESLGLRIRKNRIGLIAYVLFYQMIMSPVSVWGYIQELFNTKRIWR